MLLSQIREQDGTLQVVARDGTEAYVIRNCPSTYDLVLDCANRGVTLKERIGELGLGTAVDVEGALDEGRVLAPIHHADPARIFLSDVNPSRPECTPSSSNPRHHDQVGQQERKKKSRGSTQIDCVHKGDGNSIGAPGMELVVQHAKPNIYKGPVIAGIYVISDEGTPFRIGFSIANDFSELCMTTQAYACVAKTKQRSVALGPELLLGELPQTLHGASQICRDDVAIHEKAFGPTEDNMIHDIVKLEHLHFRSEFLRQPRHLHIHIHATYTGPFAEDVVLIEGDQASITIPRLGLPLRNSLRVVPSPSEMPVPVRML